MLFSFKWMNVSLALGIRLLAFANIGNKLIASTTQDIIGLMYTSLCLTCLHKVPMSAEKTHAS